MKVKDNLSKEEYKSIKESFFHIYHHFLNRAPISKEYVTCLFKWGVQLNVNEDEIVHYIDTEDNLAHTRERVHLLGHIYNIVYMIYLDGVVEDIELKVVSDFAETLGFDRSIVNDLLKTIVTAPYDGYSYKEVRSQLKEVLDIKEKDL